MSVETKIEIFCNKENFYPDHINKNILVTSNFTGAQPRVFNTYSIIHKASQAYCCQPWFASVIEGLETLNLSWFL